MFYNKYFKSKLVKKITCTPSLTCYLKKVQFKNLINSQDFISLFLQVSKVFIKKRLQDTLFQRV